MCMNSLAFIFIPDIVAIIPGVIALLLFLLFTYLYEQGRQPYFRAWQIGWGAYCLHYALDAWTFYHQPSAAVFLLGSLLLVVMAMCILVSTRLMREGFRLHWYDVAVAVAGSALALWNLATHITRGSFNPDLLPPSHLRLEVGLSLILGYASFQFYRYAHQKGSLAFRFLSMTSTVQGAARVDFIHPLLIFGTICPRDCSGCGSYLAGVRPLQLKALSFPLCVQRLQNGIRRIVNRAKAVRRQRRWQFTRIENICHPQWSAGPRRSHKEKTEEAHGDN